VLLLRELIQYILYHARIRNPCFILFIDTWKAFVLIIGKNIIFCFRKATRATQILVPLVVLQYLLFPIRPDAGSDLEDVYHVAVAPLVSLQVVRWHIFLKIKKMNIDKFDILIWFFFFIIKTTGEVQCQYYTWLQSHFRVLFKPNTYTF
jgi:hypothetical protein